MGVSGPSSRPTRARPTEECQVIPKAVGALGFRSPTRLSHADESFGAAPALEPPSMQLKLWSAPTSVKCTVATTTPSNSLGSMKRVMLNGETPSCTKHVELESLQTLSDTGPTRLPAVANRVPCNSAFLDLYSAMGGDWPMAGGRVPLGWARAFRVSRVAKKWSARSVAEVRFNCQS